MSLYAEWMDRAACAGDDTELWFPEGGPIPAYVRRVCESCPVSFDCLAYAVRYQIPFGIWGGATVEERRRMSGQRVA